MKRLVFSVAILIISIAANAQIYQWKDENGKTILSDKPPIGKVRIERKTEPVSINEPSPQKTMAEREFDFRKRQKDLQDSEKKSKTEQDANAAREENCTTARRHLRVLESGERLAMRDDNGERYFMEDAQREQEIEKARQVIQSVCK